MPLSLLGQYMSVVPLGTRGVVHRIKDIPVIVFDLIHFKQLFVFFQKIDLAVMFFLIDDVVDDIGKCGLCI